MSQELHGEIMRFQVTARCPHCDEETDVLQDELDGGYCQCQHCDESFNISL